MVYVTPDSLFADDAHHLWIGGMRIADLASQYGTPLYVMDETTMKNRIESYLESNCPVRIKAWVWASMPGVSRSKI